MKKSQTIYLFLFLLFGGCNLVNPYPTDLVLIQRFNSNKADIERLIKMFQEDSYLYRVSLKENAWKSFGNSAHLPEERLSEYKSLLTNLDIEYLERYENRKDVHLLVWGMPNIFIGGSSKGYFYSEEEISNTVESLDEIYRSGRESSDMKKIEGNWYLYLDVW